MGRSLQLVLLSALLLLTPGSGGQESQIEEHTAARVVRQRVRIVPRASGPESSCRRIGVDQLSVRLRGERVGPERIVELERPRGPRVHALLVDTSGSMVGELAAAREAARRYIELLDPERDRLAVLSFDDDVLLAHALDADFESADASVERLRMGGNTSLLDAVHDAITLFDGERARPILVVLTDGVDSNSLYENREVLELVGRREDLVVFTIGLKLPSIRGGRSGVAAQRFLNQLSGRSHGRFFDIYRGKQIEQTFAEVLLLLDQEAVLSIVDDRPEDRLGAVTVRSRDRNCRVVVLERLERELLQSEPVESDPIPVPPGAAIEGMRRNARHLMWKEGCAPDDATLGRLDVEGRRVRGCLLDLALAGGNLYDPWDQTRVRADVEPTFTWREVDFEVPPLDGLARTPLEVLLEVARVAEALPVKAPRTHPRKRPPERFARPFVDHPLLVDGRTLIEARPRLALALAQLDDLREVADRQLAAATRTRQQLEERRLARLRPDLPPARLQELASMSRPVERSCAIELDPRPEDLAPHLGAWLGDLPVAELFAEWERRMLRRAVAGELAPGEAEAFVSRWETTRRLFETASYSRVVGALVPAYDPAEDRVGFYRFVLPRPSWYLPRIRDDRRHPEWAGLPLDLIPPRPAAFALVAAQIEVEPAWRQRFVAAGRVEVRYSLSGGAAARSPEGAFSAMAIEWIDPDGLSEPATTRFAADARYELEASRRWFARELLAPHPPPAEGEAPLVLPLCLTRWPEPCLTEVEP